MKVKVYDGEGYAFNSMECSACNATTAAKAKCIFGLPPNSMPRVGQNSDTCRFDGRRANEILIFDSSPESRTFMLLVLRYRFIKKCYFNCFSPIVYASQHSTHPNHCEGSRHRAGFCRHLRSQNALDRWTILQSKEVVSVQI